MTLHILHKQSRISQLSVSQSSISKSAWQSKC